MAIAYHGAAVAVLPYGCDRVRLLRFRPELPALLERLREVREKLLHVFRGKSQKFFGFDKRMSASASCPGEISNSDEPALLHRRADERGKQRVRLERSRLQFGVELHPHEPGVLRILDNLRQ